MLQGCLPQMTGLNVLAPLTCCLCRAKHLLRDHRSLYRECCATSPTSPSFNVTVSAATSSTSSTYAFSLLPGIARDCAMQALQWHACAVPEPCSDSGQATEGHSQT